MLDEALYLERPGLEVDGGNFAIVENGPLLRRHLPRG
jgi:hypothetical protein